jgi:RimJ/RimL family protein N-acetyltransferase
MFETKRLILREWKDSDIPAFAAMNQDPKVMKFFPYILDLDGTKALVERIRQHFKKYGFGLFAVELKATGEFIGFVGLMTPNFEAHFMPCVEIGWRIAAPYWKQGYATEAAKMVLHLALEKYGLKEVVSFTSAVNLPSIRLMERIGLTRNPADDFYRPELPKEHPLAKHVLYRLTGKEVQDRDAILIEPYNPEWPKQAGKEVDMLKSRLDFSWIKGIQHIGSTAIPELIAKPILDLAIGVTDLESAKALIPILREEDYTFWGDNPDKSKLFFVKGMPPFGEKRTHHIHVMPVTHHDWLLRPLFRDYLIAHPGAKQAYADLKQNLASQYQSDRETYTNSKTTFIRDINLKAVKPHLHFKPLAETDFPLLLKWLEEPHVKAWWDQDIIWTPELIAKKYALNRPVQAYVILIDEMPIGYIQFYDVKDFADADRPQCSGSVAGLDYYIGEPGFLKKGFAPIILQKFLSEKVKPLFAHCLVDPDIQNASAIRAYEKAGFKAIEVPSQNVCWMLDSNI